MALTGVHLFHSLPLDRRSQQLFGFFHVVGNVATCLVYEQLQARHLCARATRCHVIESSSSTSLLYLEAGIWVLVFLFTAPIIFIAVSVL
ncbi:hypothetical protein BDZ97DRAFT_1781336 [Flammula alnicola]|nr:hypothetical protein BDZ97DRAFT_1781336 [Flammula alnicola]